MRSLILASGSPRRREILSMLGFSFEVIPADIEEDVFGDPITTARTLAKRKALRVWQRHKGSLVVGADTLVFLGSSIIGKPNSEEEAFKTLRLLSGRWHKVVTAVAVVSKGIRITVHDIARVKFKELSDREIEEYISTGEPMDKAGAYGVQGYGSTIVERIEGNFYTVMGFPIHKVFPVLKEFIG
ncbi:MAG: septum formation protein Maf [Aquificae bacterium]|nr:septum formation protein Maf [Aquificota bacterium]